MPWPADYGGVIDVYHRVVALHRQGVKVHLHCYTYGRDVAPELEQVCDEVHYYKREIGLSHQLERRPYIVASRCSQELIERLQQDDYPILLEGLHDCYVLEQLADGKRPIMVRAHNVEHDYYHALALAKSWGWKRIFFELESRKLRRYENVLLSATRVLAISATDAAHFEQAGCKNVVLLPPLHGHQEVTAMTGRGEYVLYQGNLSVAENIQAVRYIVEQVMNGLPYTLVVAGRNPDVALLAWLKAKNNVRLVANPDGEEMHRLIANAQVNLLVTQQATGVKLKLMNALYEGRHCLVNSTMVEGTILGRACVVADTPETQRTELQHLMAQPFDAEALAHRRQVLQQEEVDVLQALGI